MFRIIAAGLLVAAVAGLAVPALAQNADAPRLLSEQHLALARQVFIASETGRSFDQILPTVADGTKATLIRSNPQIQLGVIEAVDRVALEMVANRKGLDDQLVRVWALAFTEEELAGLLQFFQSPAGQKFNENYPKLISTQLGLAQAWKNQISVEMMQRTQQELQKMISEDAQKLRGTTSEGTGQ